jgi:hypothetical protein
MYMGGLKFNNAVITTHPSVPDDYIVFTKEMEYEDIDPFDEWVMEVREKHGNGGKD